MMNQPRLIPTRQKSRLVEPALLDLSVMATLLHVAVLQIFINRYGVERCAGSIVRKARERKAGSGRNAGIHGFYGTQARRKRYGLIRSNMDAEVVLAEMCSIDDGKKGRLGRFVRYLKGGG